jgi:hypothetical protein
VGDTLEEQALIEQASASWKDQLVKFVTIQPLLKEVVPWVEGKEDEKKDGVVITMVTEGEETEKKPKTHAIVTR